MRSNVKLSRTCSAVVVCALASCAYPVGDIDRTQPNKIRKSIFNGDWYFRQTVLGVPYATGLTFTGEQNDPSELIRWDIQESFLVAYRAYDLVAGTDGAAMQQGSEQPRVPVAIYEIQSHFDVQRQFNPQTGEQTNVILENETDRPWFERDFMRVDWGQNLAPSFNFLTGMVTVTPGSHYVQKPGDVDALLVARRNGGGWDERQGDGIAGLDDAQYIDVVQRMFATPGTIDVDDGYGGILTEPACWYYGNVDCAPGELRVRSAFLKRERSPYIPREFPDNAILRDENGNAIRVSYKDRDSLQQDPDGFVARAPYFDKFGYFRTERDRYDRLHGETNSGRVTLIQRHNMWANTPECVDETSETPYANCTVKRIEYWLSPGFPDDMKPAARETAVQWNDAFKQVVRTLKYGNTRPLAEVEDVFVLRENTFRMDGDRVVDRGQRVGDLRYNMLAWVDEPTQAGLLGYGPSTNDPLTGETINGAAFIYGASVDQLARRGKEIIDLINDPTRLDEFMAGEDIARELALQNANDPDADGTTRRFIRERLRTDRARAVKQGGLRRLKTDGSRTRAKLEALKDTPLEQRLMTDPILRAMGNVRSGTLTPGTANADKMSPRAWAMGKRHHLDRLRRQHLAAHRAEPLTEFDGSVMGLAQAYRDMNPNEVLQALRVAIFRSTAEHEVGHTLGLRHNFEATTDALNYGRAYWDLRGPNGQPLEPQTQSQIDGRMRELQYSSIMDYGSRFMSDIRGIGLYDRAAIAFGYGNLVEVFDAPPTEPLLDVATLDDVLRHYRHYTRLPGVFGGLDGMHARHYVRYQKVVDQLAGRADWTLWEVPYRFCSDEYDGATATCATYDEGADAYEIAQGAWSQYVEYFPFLSFSRDRRSFNEWDYMDRIYGRTLIPMLTQYQNWVFEQFYYEDTFDCLVSDSAECDDAPGNDTAHWNLSGPTWLESGDGGLPGAAATRLLLDALNAMVATPEPGAYVRDPLDNTMVVWSYDDAIPRCADNGNEEPCSDVTVPFGTGRFTDSRWDVDSGYYFYDRLQMVGSFYDKLMAIETAVTADTYFLGVDTGAEASRYLIGLSLYFPEEMYRLLGGTAAEDYASYAGVACRNDGRYVPPQLSRVVTEPCGAGEAFDVLDPATSFTVELYAIWYGMAFLTMSFDTAFVDRMKIWVDGSGEQITPTDPALVETFVNPLNNRTYHATRSAIPGAYNAGAKLLERAQRFADQYAMEPTETNRFALEGMVTTVEDVRGTHAIYGTLYF